MKTRKGILTQVDVERMEALGKAMQRALSSDDGLVALAQEMVPEITRELGAMWHSLRFARGLLRNAALRYRRFSSRRCISTASDKRGSLTPAGAS